MQDIFSTYLTEHGYLILFIWTFIEGEAGLILAGFLAFQGYFQLPLLIAVAWAGAFLGDQFYFYAGRIYGWKLFVKWKRLAKKIRKGISLIEKYGSAVAFISRYTYGFRIILPIALGMTNFSSLRFLCLNLVSALSWAITFSLAGYLFGSSSSLFLDDLKKYEHYLLALLAILIFLFWLRHTLKERKRRRPALERLSRMRQRHLNG